MVTLDFMAEEVGFDKWLISLIFRHSSLPVNRLYVTGSVAAIRVPIGPPDSKNPARWRGCFHVVALGFRIVLTGAL